MRRFDSLLVWTCVILTSCTPGERTASAQNAPPDVAIDSAAAPAPSDPLPVAPDPPDSRDLLSRIGADAPPFPYLPGEVRSVSRSIGTSSEGYLVEGKTLDFPWPHLAMLDVQSRRDLNHSTDRVLRIVTRASASVAAEHPGTITYLGNMGRTGGGDIPYSVSHNSGRDADIAFHVMNEAGEVAVMPTLLPLDEAGRYEGEHGVFVFDVARSWSLAKALMQEADEDLQYLFVADWLRDAMLEHARSVGEETVWIERGEKAMRQPTASLPHNDHFHLRVYCSERDYASGCRDTGRRQPWYRRAGRSSARKGAIRDAKLALGHDSPEFRAAAARRLALLGASGVKRELVAVLADDEPFVRAAGARALGALGVGGAELAVQARVERHPAVMAEIVSALGAVGGQASVDALARVLERERELDVVDGLRVDARALAADALSTMESTGALDALIGALTIEHGATRARVARALWMTTNHRFLDGPWEGDDVESQRDAIVEWVAWRAKWGKQPRDAWLMQGFKARSYAVDSLTGKHVWEICRAISDEDFMSYNAQRVLMRIARREPATLSWSKADASFYWRRWFERRRRRFGAPPVPEGMSTLEKK